jgi:outer membrane protein
MKRILLIVVISIIAAAACISVYHFAFTSKLGFIQTGIVLQEYKGMKDVENQYTSELSTVQSNVDTLRSRYERMLRNIEEENPDEQEKRAIQQAHSEWQRYSEKASRQMEQRRLEMNKEVFEDLNRITQSYGENHGYDIIFGSTSSGSIMYGKEAIDLTEEIIRIMNEQYQQNDE